MAREEKIEEAIEVLTKERIFFECPTSSSSRIYKYKDQHIKALSFIIRFLQNRKGESKCK